MSIKAGTYISKASVWGLSETKSGAEQFAIEFPVTDEHGETHVLTYFGSFSEKAEKHTLKALRACGWVGNDLSKVNDLPNEVQLVVENEEYEGEWRTKIKWVNSIGGAIRHLELRRPHEGARRRIRCEQSWSKAGDASERQAAHAPAAVEESGR